MLAAARCGQTSLWALYDSHQCLGFSEKMLLDLLQGLSQEPSWKQPAYFQSSFASSQCVSQAPQVKAAKYSTSQSPWLQEQGEIYWEALGSCCSDDRARLWGSSGDPGLHSWSHSVSLHKTPSHSKQGSRSTGISASAQRWKLSVGGGTTEFQKLHKGTSGVPARALHIVLYKRNAKQN